jgi:DNA-binding IscR family transcriptional regulator
MRKDNRLSRMLHVLIHMDKHDTPTTSERIAQMLNTNPVVIRRMMAGLRDKNFVCSEKGHGGGWKLTCKLDEITLLDVHQALGGTSLFTIGLESNHSGCLVEKAVNAALGDALLDAEQLLLERFRVITLDKIASVLD